MTINRLSTFLPKTVLLIVLLIGLGAGGVTAVRYALNELNSAGQQPSTATLPPPTPTLKTAVASSTVGASTAATQRATDEDAHIFTPTAAIQTAVNTPAALAEQLPIGNSTLELTDGVYLRAGPGTNYAILGSEPAGYIAPVTGQSADGQWYQIAYGARNRVWVSALWSSVNANGANIPVVEAPSTPKPEASATPAATLTGAVDPTATSGGLTTTDSSDILGKTFSLDAHFVPDISGPRSLVGAEFNVNMRIANSSTSDISFGAWGVHTNLYPNFIYIFNGDRPADKIGANTEYSWDSHPISIINPGLHQLQMGICLDNAANCLASKAPGTNWFIISEAIPMTISESRLSPVTPDGSPITGTYFSVEKTCTAGTSCAATYTVNESIFVNLRISNPHATDQKFGAWGVYADPYIFRFFRGDGDADKVNAGSEYVWRDHVEIPAAGNYDFRMAICIDTSTNCGTTTPPSENWYFLSNAIPVTIN